MVIFRVRATYQREYCGPLADLLFQVISQRCERGPLVITSNLAYKQWAKIFNHDATLTSAVLDRLLHHAETVTLEGRSYRMKDQLPET